MQQPQTAMHCSESRRMPQKTAASDLPQLLGFIFQMYPPEKYGNVGSTGLLCCSAEIVSIDGNLDVCIPYRTWMSNTPTTSSCASRWAYEVQLDVLLYCWRGVLFTNLMNLSKHHKQHRVIRKIMTITWAPQKMFLLHLGCQMTDLWPFQLEALDSSVPPPAFANIALDKQTNLSSNQITSTIAHWHIILYRKQSSHCSFAHH